MYRPQFPYATPPGCRDEDVVYTFDGSNVPLFAAGLVAGQVIPEIPLPLQQDAPFYWRGWKFEARKVGGGPSAPDINIRLRDVYDNYLSDDFVPAVEYGFVQDEAFPISTPPVILEPEIYCPRGGVLYVFLQGGNFLGTFDPILTLFGVKRLKGCA